ncbi:hypothetical protein F4859DRAFT_522274 [Xylaria cf. heliscus]|nr:hypothetical protein F4859DRAFT_522274 [Xylaria cf. heliscus]
MADAVSAVASVLQLVSATAKLVQYCADVGHAQAEARELMEECAALNLLLVRLEKDDRLQNEQTARPLVESLNDLKPRIDDLAAKLSPESRLRKLSRDMLWPISKKEIREVMKRATRLTGLINSWDVKDLINSIKQDTIVLPDMAETIQNTLSMTVQNDRQQTRELMNKMVNYFSPVSFSEKQNEIFSQRQPGTAQWFIDSPEFQDWLLSLGATLWCPGAPGSGKTFIASIVVDYLQGLVKTETETGITYVFCDFRRRTQEPTALLANIWTQLILQRDFSKAEIDQLHDDLYARRVKLSAAQLNGLVEKEFTDGKFQRMFVVIDALDECNEAQRETLLDHVTLLYPWANVLITSRVMGSDRERFTDVRVLRVIAAEADLHAYIRTRITSSRKLAANVQRKQDLEKEIHRIVSKRAQGLLHMDSLALESTPKAVRKVLESIPMGDTAMKDTYDNADDIELSEDDIISTDLLVEYCCGLVVIEPETKIVRFVHFTTQEYFEAQKNTPLLAGTVGSIALTCITFLSFDDPFLNDEATLPGINDVQKATPFLEYATVYFGKHYHRMRSMSGSIDTALARDISDVMIKFFKSAVKVHRAAVSALYTILARWRLWPGSYQPVGNLNVSAIDLGAFYDVLMPNDTDAVDALGPADIPLTVQWFKRHAETLTGVDIQSFGNALHWAALGNSIGSINLLLQDSSLNLDIQETNTWGIQPAHVSAVFCSAGTLLLLFEQPELKVNSLVGDNSPWTGTILHLAIRSMGSGSEAEKIALIDAIVERDVQGKLMVGYDIYGANPLILAVKEAGYPTFQRVLRYFDAVAGDSIWKTRRTADLFSKTPLHWAVMDCSFVFKNRTVAADSGPLLKLKALLDHPLAWQLMCMRDNKAEVPFEDAVRRSHIHAVEYMITKAVEHQWPMFDQLLMSALYLAVEVAHWTVVELLLSKVGPELLAKPDQDATVLHHTARGASRGAMKFLLQRLEKADLHNVRDRQRMTPLHVAALAGNLDAVEALLELQSIHCIEIDARDEGENTPLHLAALHDVGDVCSKLLAAGSNCSIQNARGLTPLAVALEQRPSSALQAIMMSCKFEKPCENLDDATIRWLEVVAQSSYFGEALREDMAHGTLTGERPIEICRNQMANRQWCTHEIAWDVGYGEAGGIEATWVRSLRPGNSILVIPRAMFPGWENWVRRVTIDVYTSCLRYSEDRLDI